MILPTFEEIPNLATANLIYVIRYAPPGTFEAGAYSGEVYDAIMRELHARRDICNAEYVAASKQVGW